MVQTTSKLFDEIAKVLTSTAGAAQGLKSELDIVVKTQVERLLNDLDVVQREQMGNNALVVKKMKMSFVELILKGLPMVRLIVILRNRF